MNDDSRDNVVRLSPKPGSGSAAAPLERDQDPWEEADEADRLPRELLQTALEAFGHDAEKAWITLHEATRRAGEMIAGQAAGRASPSPGPSFDTALDDGLPF